MLNFYQILNEINIVFKLSVYFKEKFIYFLMFKINLYLCSQSIV